LELRSSHAPPATDASGENDYGHIDEFLPVQYNGENVWEMSGDWGDLLTVEPAVSLAFE